MADHHATQDGGHPAMDYAEHEKTYNLFIMLSKWGTIIVIGIMVFMAIVLL